MYLNFHTLFLFILIFSRYLFFDVLIIRILYKLSMLGGIYRIGYRRFFYPKIGLFYFVTVEKRFIFVPKLTALNRTTLELKQLKNFSCCFENLPLNRTTLELKP